jgi:hypothetical protein
MRERGGIEIDRGYCRREEEERKNALL